MLIGISNSLRKRFECKPATSTNSENQLKNMQNQIGSGLKNLKRRKICVTTPQLKKKSRKLSKQIRE